MLKGAVLSKQIKIFVMTFVQDAKGSTCSLHKQKSSQP